MEDRIRLSLTREEIEFLWYAIEDHRREQENGIDWSYSDDDEAEGAADELAALNGMYAKLNAKLARVLGKPAGMNPYQAP